MSCYRTIVADPPWTPGLSKTWSLPEKSKGRPQKHYQTLTLNEIIALKPPSEDKSHLWLWVINQHVDWGYIVAREWGFEPINLITWAKPGLGVGQFQSNTEHCLMCRKGNRAGNPFGATKGTWFNWSRGRHSQKPEEFYQLVERVSPPNYLEMFARQRRDGWDVFGNEVNDSITLL